MILNLKSTSDDTDAARRKAEEDANMKVRFERRFHDDEGKYAGATRFYGPRISRRGNLGEPPQTDYVDWYFDEAKDEWVEVPEGWMAIRAGYEGDAVFDF